MTVKEIFSQIGFASVIMTTGIAALSVSDIFIARHLSPQEYGSFTLIFRDAATILSSLLLLGMDSSLVRLFGREEIELYRWKGFLLAFIRVIVGISFLAGILLTLVYSLEAWTIVALSIQVTLLSTLTLFSTVLRVRGRISKAQISLNIWRAGFALLIIPLYLTGFFSVASLAGLLIASLLLSLVFLLKSTAVIPNGNQTMLARPLLREGILFFALSASSLLMFRIERFFLGGLENFSEVAGYYAVSLPILTVYWILASSGAYVLLPQFGRGFAVNLKYGYVLLTFLGLLIGIPFILFGNDFISFLFDGKYDEYSFLIPMFVGLGSLQLVYLLPSSLIGGRASTQQLRMFLSFGLATLGLTVGLCLLLIPPLGVTGAVVSNLAAWGARLLAAMWFARRVLRSYRGEPVTS